MRCSIAKSGSGLLFAREMEVKYFSLHRITIPLIKSPVQPGEKRERDLTERKQQRILNSAISKKPLKDHERRSIQWLREFDFLDSQMKSRKHGLSLRLQISIELLGDGGNLLRDCVNWISRYLRKCC